MNLKRIHHVAYRCNDAKETVDFYQRMLNMDFTVAFAEDKVPSTKEPDPYMHVFLDAGMGNVLAFFELPTQEPMDRDHNTPAWVQHIAFEVEDYDALVAAKEHIAVDYMSCCITTGDVGAVAVGGIAKVLCEDFDLVIFDFAIQQRAAGRRAQNWTPRIGTGINAADPGSHERRAA